MSVPAVSYRVTKANPKLWMVKSFLDLINRPDPLVPGEGIKALYVMSIGLDTYNEEDIHDATRKAQAMGLIPFGLTGFMTTCILKNCLVYGKLLQSMINDRIVAIARGDIENPPATLKWSPKEARRYYYLPPFVFLQKLQKALLDDYGYDSHQSSRPIVNRLEDVVVDAELYLNQAQGSEGYSTPQQSSFATLTRCVEDLVSVLDQEIRYPSDQHSYQRRAMYSLKIIWFIAKMLMGDLTIRPDRSDMEIVDLNGVINISDGTLAAIPFPTNSTVKPFCVMDEGHGVTLKGKTYLAAASLAAFDQSDPNCVDCEGCSKCQPQ